MEQTMSDNKTDTISVIESLREELEASKEMTCDVINSLNHIRHELIKTEEQGTLECCHLKAKYSQEITALTSQLHRIQSDFRRERAKLRLNIKF